MTISSLLDPDQLLHRHLEHGPFSRSFRLSDSCLITIPTSLTQVRVHRAQPPHKRKPSAAGWDTRPTELRTNHSVKGQRSQSLTALAEACNQRHLIVGDIDNKAGIENRRPLKQRRVPLASIRSGLKPIIMGQRIGCGEGKLLFPRPIVSSSSSRDRETAGSAVPASNTLLQGRVVGSSQC